MQRKQPKLQKPRSEKIRPELTRLPNLNTWRIILRSILRFLAKVLLRLTARIEIRGLDNFPRNGPALIVTNHIGDADVLLGLAFLPTFINPVAKTELFDFPVLGRLMDAYGVVWIHRGQADRRALRAACQVLEEGRFLAIAPEGRESVTGSLEEGTRGAAFIALKTDVPLLPITFTGTENTRIYGNLKKLRRSRITMTVGSTFKLKSGMDKQQSLKEGTRDIMMRLADLLPKEYRGIYQGSMEED